MWTTVDRLEEVIVLRKEDLLLVDGLVFWTFRPTSFTNSSCWVLMCRFSSMNSSFTFLDLFYRLESRLPRWSVSPCEWPLLDSDGSPAQDNRVDRVWLFSLSSSGLQDQIEAALQWTEDQVAWQCVHPFALRCEECFSHLSCASDWSGTQGWILSFWVSTHLWLGRKEVAGSWNSCFEIEEREDRSDLFSWLECLFERVEFKGEEGDHRRREVSSQLP